MWINKEGSDCGWIMAPLPPGCVPSTVTSITILLLGAGRLFCSLSTGGLTVPSHFLEFQSLLPFFVSRSFLQSACHLLTFLLPFPCAIVSILQDGTLSPPLPPHLPYGLWAPFPHLMGWLRGLNELMQVKRPVQTLPTVLHRLWFLISFPPSCFPSGHCLCF